MRTRLPLIAATVLALALASGAAQAQSAARRDDTKKLVPVLNRDDGKLEAVLLLEPATTGTGAGARWHFGNTTLEATYGLRAGDSLALLCDRRSGLSSAIGQLANNCVMAMLDRKGNAS